MTTKYYLDVLISEILFMLWLTLRASVLVGLVCCYVEY